MSSSLISSDHGSSTTSNVKCIFCGETEPLDDTLDGRFVEVEYDKDFAIGHYLCVSWAPEVHIDDDGTFRDVAKSHRRGKKLVCVVSAVSCELCSLFIAMLLL